LGKINSYDLKQIFTTYGVYISLEEARLIMSRFDRDKDEYLTFEEFVDMWVPLDEVFAASLDNRSHKYPNGYYTTDEIFDSITRSNFVEVLKLTLEVEQYAERIRQQLSGRPFFSYSEAYDTLNKCGSCFVKKDDFSSLLQRHRFYATNKELNMLMDRFDKDKDERVSYSEFISEITPHSPQKF
jgi:Ca2+-binding EF-hand superfamily protein